MKYTSDVEKYDKVFEEMREIFVKKNSDYGGSFRKLGAKGLFVDIYRKVQRMKNIIWDENDVKVDDETIRDTLLDLANYAIMMAIVYDEGNIDGEVMEDLA